MKGLGEEVVVCRSVAGFADGEHEGNVTTRGEYGWKSPILRTFRHRVCPDELKIIYQVVSATGSGSLP